MASFYLADRGDSTTDDQLGVSSLTSDGGATSVTRADVIVTDTNSDGTGDAALSFSYGENITLVGVLALQIKSTAELDAMGIPNTGAAPDFIVGGIGGDCQDTLYGGVGNETIIGGTESGQIYGGDGDLSRENSLTLM